MYQPSDLIDVASDSSTAMRFTQQVGRHRVGWHPMMLATSPAALATLSYRFTSHPLMTLATSSASLSTFLYRSKRHPLTLATLFASM